MDESITDLYLMAFLGDGGKYGGGVWWEEADVSISISI